MSSRRRVSDEYRDPERSSDGTGDEDDVEVIEEDEEARLRRALLERKRARGTEEVVITQQQQKETTKVIITLGETGETLERDLSQTTTYTEVSLGQSTTDEGSVGAHSHKTKPPRIVYQRDCCEEEDAEKQHSKREKVIVDESSRKSDLETKQERHLLKRERVEEKGVKEYTSRDHRHVRDKERERKAAKAHGRSEKDAHEMKIKDKHYHYSSSTSRHHISSRREPERLPRREQEAITMGSRDHRHHSHKISSETREKSSTSRHHEKHHTSKTLASKAAAEPRKRIKTGAAFVQVASSASESSSSDREDSLSGDEEDDKKPKSEDHSSDVEAKRRRREHKREAFEDGSGGRSENVAEGNDEESHDNVYLGNEHPTENTEDDDEKRAKKKGPLYSRFDSDSENSDEQTDVDMLGQHPRSRMRGDGLSPYMTGGSGAGTPSKFPPQVKFTMGCDEEQMDDEDIVDEELPEFVHKNFEELTDEEKVLISPHKLAAMEREWQRRLIAQLPVYYPGIRGCRSVTEYQCDYKINEGTFGVVYRATEKRTDEVVALKRLKMEKEKQGFPITSLREINMLLKCGQHPNIVNVREVVVGTNMDKIYLVMDYVDHDIKVLMDQMKQRQKKFTTAQVKTLMLHLLNGVKFMHEEYILHRDLKTSNLLMSNQGILKIGDFGLAREYGNPLKPYTPVVVTLWYRSPELLLGTKLYSTAIDLWSVGCIFAEFLKLHPLFPGNGDLNQLERIFKELGTPNEEVWPMCSTLPGMKHYVFATMPFNQLRKKFPELMNDESGFSLLNKLLALCPERRLSAEEALDSKWFTQDPKPAHPSSFPTWPSLRGPFQFKADIAQKNQAPMDVETMAARVAAATGQLQTNKLSSEALQAAAELKMDPKKVAAAAAGFSLKFDAPKFSKK